MTAERVALPDFARAQARRRHPPGARRLARGALVDQL